MLLTLTERRCHCANGEGSGRNRGARVAAVVIAAVVGTAAAYGQTDTVTYRTYDGTGNNVAHPTWGSAGSQYLREASGAHYADGVRTPAGGDRPSARVISNLIVDQGGIEIENIRGLSTCVYEFGQFLDHDFGLAKGSSAEPMGIAVPNGDPWFDPNHTGTQMIPFSRSAFDPATGTTTARQQVNTVTSFIDASQVYGSDPVRAAWLRTNTGGHLKVNHESYGDMLPYNDGTLSNDNPLGLPATSLYAAGDPRANEQVGLTTLHVVFVREHNWQADRLHAQHPTWNDEKLYQEARRWVGAEMQVITYREFLPAMLGRTLPPYTGYKPGVNPGLSNAFAAAGYRIGHSMVGPDIDILDENFEETGVMELAEAFFNPAAIPGIGGIEPVTRYFATSTQQETDTMIVDPLRNFLFGPPGSGGMDLASLNIQRGRDHGLGDYNTVRHDFGLARVTSFGQITSNTALAQELQQLYGNVNTIDAWVGMLAEDHVAGSSVGPTHMAVLIDQFRRLRDGDRFWYQNNQFSLGELLTLETTRLSTIVGRATGITRFQSDLFYAADLTQPPPACYANCDGSAAPPVLNVADFVCFLNKFASGDPYANCDGSTTPPVLNVSDIACFLQKFAQGCP